MNASPSYSIYSASAGAGKTSTLTVRYLTLILRDEQPLAFRNILGITFTNKAVGEMKNRILSALNDFDTSEKKSAFLFEQVLEAVNTYSKESVSEELLRARARKRLKELLHNYAYFDISTIDKFNHRLIKTFAKDLKLSSSFKVILDQDEFLNEGLDALFTTLSEDEVLKSALVDFAVSKIENNNSWDIAYDLHKTSKLLFDETHFRALEQLSTKTDKDFKFLIKEVKQRLKTIKSDMITIASTTLELLEDKGLLNSFSRNYFPKLLEKFQSGSRPGNMEMKWLLLFDEQDPYTKTTPEDEKELIDELKPSLSKVLVSLKTLYKDEEFFENAYKNIQPLSLIFKVQQQLQILMDEQERLPISEFNKRIFEVVRKQAVPFIYERLGERYKHFFIDEFQDTSVLQWENLIPLVANALSIEEGSAMLVGDPKQAIYRWRGGAAKQLIALYENPKEPFPVTGTPIALETNYRSTKTIVDFNNSFFELSAESLQNQEVKRLFKETSRQEVHNSTSGWVAIEFVEGAKVDDRKESYCEKTLNHIKAIVAQGFSYADICVLTRVNKQSVALAEYLTQAEIPIVSSESLLLKSSDEVCFLVDLLYASFWPNEQYYQAKILEFLHKNQDDQSQQIKEGLEHFEGHLETNFGFSMAYFNAQEVIDALSYAIEQFSLAQEASAYITYFLDQVYEYVQTEFLGVSGFLERWEEHQEDWSVKSPKAVNAVQLMTIHKSKGLEFDFVILPFAEQEIVQNKTDEVLWMPVNPEEFAGFDQLLFNKKKSLKEYNEHCNEVIDKEDGLKSMDSLNTLYVALTRAVKGLVILSAWDENKEGVFKAGTFSKLFHDFLKAQKNWDGSLSYEINTLADVELGARQSIDSATTLPFRYSHKKEASYRLLTHEKLQLDDAAYEAKEAGTTWHRFLEFVHSQEDLNYAAIKLLEEYPFESKEVFLVKGAELINHPSLKQYFQPGIKAVNEQTIFTAEGEELRPDRLVFFEDKVVIIDYKTGEQQDSHVHQINRYARALEALNYQISKRLIVYIHPTITIKTLI